jgi:hypothetical protein
MYLKQGRKSMTEIMSEARLPDFSWYKHTKSGKKYQKTAN